MNRNIAASLVWAALMIAGALAVAYGQDAGWTDAGDQRGAGVVIGLVLAWTGNMVPKWGAGQECRGDAFRMRRFAGLSLILGGLLHAAAWIIAPIVTAAWWSMAPVSVAMFVILGLVVSKRPVP